MSFAIEQALRPELGRSERLLWSGIPQQGLRLRAADILMVPFSLLWGGFAVFWEYSVVSKGAPLFFALWGIPFVLVGIYIVVGRFFVDSYQRARTYYGVTDQRIIIRGGLIGREIKSLSIQSLHEVSLTERADRSGSITFGPSSPLYAMWSGPAWPGMGKKLAPAFDLIPNVRAVYDLIRETQRSGASRRA
jgi:hypothetical protein